MTCVMEEIFPIMRLEMTRKETRRRNKMDLIEIVLMNREKKVEVALRPEATLTYFKLALRSLHRSLTTEHTLTETTTPQAKKGGRRQPIYKHSTIYDVQT